MSEIKIRLPKPHAGQQQVLNSKAKIKVLLCGRRWGKSLVSHIIAIQHMLAGKRVAYVTPQYSLAKDMFKELLGYIAPLVTTENKSDLYIQIATKGSIQFFSGDSEKTLDGAFRGKRYNLVIMDESSYISELEAAWNGAIYPTISQYTDSEAIFISTPRGRDFMYSMYLKGKTGEDPDIESFHFPTSSNPYYPASEIEKARKMLPVAKFNEEYLALPGENSNSPFTTESIQAGIIPKLSDKPSTVYGIDIARSKDWTVIIGLDGDGNMSHYERFQQAFEITKNRIKALPANVIKVIDKTGLGAPIFEALQLDGVENMIGFLFTTQSKPVLCFELIKAIEVGKLGYLESVAEEMYVFEQRTTATGHITFSALSGYTDDQLMALGMAYKYWKKAEVMSQWELYSV